MLHSYYYSPAKTISMGQWWEETCSEGKSLLVYMHCILIFFQICTGLYWFPSFSCPAVLTVLIQH